MPLLIDWLPAAANIYVGRAHMNKTCDSIANKQKQARKQAESLSED